MPMDQTTRPAETGTAGTSVRQLSRRTFFSLARVALLGTAGIAVFGVGTTIRDSAAKESSDEGPKEKEKTSKEKEKEKNSKEKPRDKDQDAKEKERESNQKEEGQ